MKTYLTEIVELIDLCRLMGVGVKTRDTEDFDLQTFGEYDATSRTITLFYEKELTHCAATLFTLAHEMRHAFQHLTSRYEDYWLFAIGVGPKPPTELKDEMEADADRFASEHLKGKGIRIPKKMLE